ncbi:hypothetical protein C8R45DRAFT_1218997 [Mycena sanguinolenta]|nr:hypothetical protein C8R45DRAFT_1218997 [Mycena sanguinolenta]
MIVVPPTRPATISGIALNVERTFIELARADVDRDDPDPPGRCAENTRHPPTPSLQRIVILHVTADELASGTCHLAGCYSGIPDVCGAGLEAMKSRWPDLRVAVARRWQLGAPCARASNLRTHKHRTFSRQQAAVPCLPVASRCFLGSSAHRHIRIRKVPSSLSQPQLSMPVSCRIRIFGAFALFAIDTTTTRDSTRPSSSSRRASGEGEERSESERGPSVRVSTRSGKE